MDHSEVKHLPKVDHTPAELDDASRLLLRAADIIETGGWCRGDLELDGRHCVDGAMNVAGTGRCEYSNDPVVRAASDRFSTYIGDDMPSRWNNVVASSKEEVAAKLRAAALWIV